jgi:heme A synthase
MDSTIKMLHSYWAYFVLIVLFAAVINALIGFVGKKEYNAKDLRVSLFTLIVSHIQLLLGLTLYFVSPMFEVK